MPKVSIIMPSLNVAKYIKQCMESVLNQTLKDIEIIAVDAGSTDGTLEILKKFEAEDKRIQLIYSDKRSYGYQVNLGISKAQGDYIGVVETDDYIDSNMYESLYKLAIESNADYVKGSAERVLSLGDGCEYKSKIEVFTEEEFSQNNGLITVNPSNTPKLILKDYYLWTGIYKKDFIKAIRLNETAGAAYQDIGFMIQTFCKAKKALYIDKVFYYYRQDNPNASGYNPKAFSFLVEEYKYVDTLLQGQAEIWHTISYCKMFRQANHRIKLMALSGSLWDSSIGALQIISIKLKETLWQSPIAAENLTSQELLELELMIKNPEELYEYFKSATVERCNKLISLLEKLASTKEIVIFGSGKLGEFAPVLLQLNGINTIKAYCDNDSALWGKKLQGKPILSPSEAVQIYPKAVYLVANKLHRQEIKQQLVNMGININKICDYTLGIDPMLLNKVYLNK